MDFRSIFVRVSKVNLDNSRAVLATRGRPWFVKQMPKMETPVFVSVFAAAAVVVGDVVVGNVLF